VETQDQLIKKGIGPNHQEKAMLKKKGNIQSGKIIELRTQRYYQAGNLSLQFPEDILISSIGGMVKKL